MIFSKDTEIFVIKKNLTELNEQNILLQKTNVTSNTRIMSLENDLKDQKIQKEKKLNDSQILIDNLNVSN